MVLNVEVIRLGGGFVPQVLAKSLDCIVRRVACLGSESLYLLPHRMPSLELGVEFLGSLHDDPNGSRHLRI